MINHQLESFLQQEQKIVDQLLSEHFGYFLLNFNNFNCIDVDASAIPNQYNYSKSMQFGTDISGDYYQLPFATGSVDMVILPHVLSMVEHKHLVIEEVYRVLRNDGYIIITDFNHWRFKSYKLWKVLNLRRRHNKSCLVKRPDLISSTKCKSLLEQCGFELINGVGFGLTLPAKLAEKGVDSRLHEKKIKQIGLFSNLFVGYAVLAKKQVLELTATGLSWKAVGKTEFERSFKVKLKNKIKGNAKSPAG